VSLSITGGFNHKKSFHPGERDCGVSTGFHSPGVFTLQGSMCFHPGERDCGVSTSRNRFTGSSLLTGMVSIPASGIVVFLRSWLQRCRNSTPSTFPSRRAGLWCFYYDQAQPGDLGLGVSIPASGIVVFLLSGLKKLQIGFSNTPVSIPASGIVVFLLDSQLRKLMKRGGE